jgi:hypothetical protein
MGPVFFDPMYAVADRGIRRVWARLNLWAFVLVNADQQQTSPRRPLQVVLRARLDQGEKLSARVLLVEDPYHGRGYGG